MSNVAIGKPAPAFQCTGVIDGRLKGLSHLSHFQHLQSDNITEISLSSYTDASHWLVLVFFPKAWSYICPTEIQAFNARLEEFLYSRQCAVAFASTDSEQCLKAWNNSSEMEGGLGGVHVPLISDCNHKLSREYGVLIEEEGVAQRSMFIIDPKGLVRHCSINDPDIARSVDETLRIIDALAFKDAFGVGCPADWKKGDAGIRYSDSAKVDGPIEVKKSWTDWARPKFNRTLSGTSQRSVAGSSMRSSNIMVAAPSESPMMSPTSVGNAFMERNMEAAMANQSLGVAI